MKRITQLSIIALMLLSIGCGVKENNDESLSNTPATVSQEELIKRGAYLVEVAGCNDCHSPKVMTEHGPIPDPERKLSGHPASNPSPIIENANGVVVFDMNLTAAVGPWGTSFAANLTPDETGIGNWTYEQFKNALTKGMSKGLENTRFLLPPMPWTNYRNMEEEDIQAIYAYLKSIPAISNVVPNPINP